MDVTKLGALDSPTDSRDFNTGTIQAPISFPSTWLPDYSALDVWYQNGQPSCGGHAGAKAVHIFEFKETGENVKLSPRFVYALCKKLDGLPVESGTYARAIMKVLQTYGVTEDRYFPNQVGLDHDTYADFSRITPQAYDNAHPRAIGAYAQVPITLDALKENIYRNGWVLILKKPWQVGIASGHFIVADGYDTDKIRFINSFGSWWGDQGHAWLTSQDMDSVIEAWTAVDIPNWLIPGLKTQVSLLRTVSELLAKLISLKVAKKN